MGENRRRGGEDLLHTAIDTLNSSSSSSSSKFGSFILHAAVDFEKFREDAVFMLSSVSESESKSRSSESARYNKSFGLWSTGFNGVCSNCDSGSGSGWRWSDNDGLRCCKCKKLHNNISGGEGGGGELSNDDDQQQQQLLLMLGNLGFPSCYSFGGNKPPKVMVDDDQQQQQLLLKLDNLGFPSCYSFGGNKPPKVMVVGSCDGLICLYDEQSNDVSFWNPATRQFRILPKSSSSITIAALAAAGDGNVHRLFAFGFDEKTKDYKVVLLSVSRRRMLDFVIKDEPAAPLECVCRVEVYSSTTNSWTLLKGITSFLGSPFPYPPDSSSELFYLNGCCFFMAKLLYSSEEQQQCIPPPKMSDRFMISLDLTNETVTLIQLPSHHYLHQVSLFYLGRKIAFCYKQEWACREVNGDGVNVSTCFQEVFCIYVFNELSSVEGSGSWEYVHRFSIKLGLPAGERNILRGISNDAVFALIETEILGGLGSKKKKLRLYNLITKEMKKNFLSCDQVLSKAIPYKPSLVWIAAAAAAADMVVIGPAGE